MLHFPPTTAWKKRKHQLPVVSMCGAGARWMVCRGPWHNMYCYPMRRGAWLMRRGAWGSASRTNSVVFNRFSSVFPSCNALELQINFIYFLLSANVFYEPLNFNLLFLDSSPDVLFYRFTWFFTKKTQNT